MRICIDCKEKKKNNDFVKIGDEYLDICKECAVDQDEMDEDERESWQDIIEYIND